MAPGIDRTVVHVRDVVAGACRVGLVIADHSIPAGATFPELRVRVIAPSGIGPVGVNDDEGTYRHTADALTVDGPYGPRTLDSWHRIGSCLYAHDAPAGAGAMVEAERG